MMRTFATANTAAALFLSVCGCSISAGPELDARAGLGCVDDTPTCVSRRQATLRLLVDDKSKAWVKEPASPEAYASGVRLFALKSKRRDLTCDELAHARREADGARPALTSAAGKLTPAQVSRGSMLAAEVSRELQSEIKRRCKRG